MKAIIFDFDGVILDTEHAVYESWQRQYESHGLDLAMSDWISVLGMPSDYRDFHTELETLLGRSLDRSRLKAQRQAYIKEQLHDVPPRAGVLDYLKHAKQDDLRLSIASGSGRSWVTGHLEQLGLDNFFDAIVTREDTKRHKPYPEPFLAAAEAVGVDPGHCIVIEDSPNGIRAAKSAGMYAVAYPTDMTCKEDFDSIGADRVVHSLAELPLPQLLQEIQD